MKKNVLPESNLVDIPSVVFIKTALKLYLSVEAGKLTWTLLERTLIFVDK